MNGFDLSQASNICLGSTSVSAVYLGSTKIWPSAPHDYSQDYLTFRLKYPTGGSYIGIGFMELTSHNDAQTIPRQVFEYSLDNGQTWTQYTVGYAYNSSDGTNTITTHEENYVNLYGGDNDWHTMLWRGNLSTTKTIHLICTNFGLNDYDFELEGNMGSLLYGDNFYPTPSVQKQYNILTNDWDLRIYHSGGTYVNYYYTYLTSQSNLVLP